MNIKVINMFEKNTDPNGIYINTTSSAEFDWQRDLSPFYIGPCCNPENLSSRNFENLWQYSKVYQEYTDKDGNPSDDFYNWQVDGFNNPRAVRYPMGKNARPLYAWWGKKKLDYIQARKAIYVRKYIECVIKTFGLGKLAILCLQNPNKTIYLKDYDAYRHEDLKMTLSDVLNDPTRKMGHAFVLLMLLTGDQALFECSIEG